MNLPIFEGGFWSEHFSDVLLSLEIIEVGGIEKIPIISQIFKIAHSFNDTVKDLLDMLIMNRGRDMVKFPHFLAHLLLKERIILSPFFANIVLVYVV